MNYKKPLLYLLFLFLSSLTQAQPNSEYIHKLTGDVNTNWLKSAGNSSPNQTLTWTTKKVPGFRGTPASARKQVALSQDWNFYSVDTNKVIGEPSKIKLPHKFKNNRNYRSGWYVTKYQFNKAADKRLVLMLNRVSMFTVVYVNGQRIGDHFGAFTPFEFDITSALIAGENTLAIFVYDQTASVDGDKAYNQLGPVWLKSSYSQGREDKELNGGIDVVPIFEVREYASIQDVFVKTSTRKGEMQIDFNLAFGKNVSAKSKLSFEVLKWPAGERVALDIKDVELNKSTDGTQSHTVKWKNPNLWSPDHPNLYVLRTTLKNGNHTDVLETRFGFREFWIEGKTFIINGFPTRLRGESTFRTYNYNAKNYQEMFRMYKEIFAVNAFRIHAFMPPGEIMQAADEAGVLLIDQSAIWSVNVMFYKNGDDWFLKNIEKEYKEWALRDRNSPSVVIWDVENEMLRYSYERHLPWVSKLSGFIKKYDDTRPFNYSGAGFFSKTQDMASLHMQEHYTRIMKDWISKGTYPLIMGEFWVGGRMEQRLPTSPELTSVHERYVEEARIYEDKLLEMRYLGVSGIMPFRFSLLSFYNGDNSQEGSKSKVQIRSDDVIGKIKHGLQPVCVFFWPRRDYSSAEKTFQRELVIANDGETADNFEVAWQFGNQPEKKETVELLPGAQKKILVNEIASLVPAKLIASIRNKQGLISTDTLLINPIPASKFVGKKEIQVYNDENLAKMLNSLGFKSESKITLPTVEDNVLLIIPENANNRELKAHKDELLDYLNDGGNILCLKQDQSPSWFPIKFQFWSANQTSPHTYALMGWEGLQKDLFYAKNTPILAKSHPVFAGIISSNLNLWDDYDGRVSDDVFVRPASANKYEQGNWRPLVTGSRREHVGLAEMFYGQGTLLSCQLNVVKSIDNLQAKTLLTNMLNYLSTKQPESLINQVAVSGILSPEDLSDLTGATKEAFQKTTVAKNDLMIAFNGADMSEIKDWANKGGKVLVFSDSLSQLFEGVKTSGLIGGKYLATKVADHKLLEGVSSANFLNNKPQIIKDYFTEIPSNAKVLLQGFEGTDFFRIKEAGPVMISVPYGKGEILLSTIEIGKDASPASKELLSLLLTNDGVSVPFAKSSKNEEILVKKTVPITVDGKLNEWLEDMEDRNVTQFVHAQPVFLTSENIVEGPPDFDLKLSAIDYFLWNQTALHIAGVVFSEERTYETGIGYGSEKEYVQEIRYNNDVITISVKNKQAKVLVNSLPVANQLIKIGQINSKRMTDAINLRFDYILASGKIASVDNLNGETFELKIPWEMLKSKRSDEKVKALISIQSKDTKIQTPFSASPTNRDTWLDMKLK